MVSIAAGVSIDSIHGRLNERQRVVRVMPNTPCLVGTGVSAVASGPGVTDDDLSLTETCLAATGLVVHVSEDAMDAVTAVSGSGPAYYFYFIEHVIRAAEELGLDHGLAVKLAYGTIRGAAAMLQEDGESPQTLRARVTSKGGTTEAAVRSLDARWRRRIHSRGPACGPSPLTRAVGIVDTELMAKSGGKKKKGGKSKQADMPNEGCLHRLIRGTVTLLLVVGIIGVTLLLFTRTDGFRSYLEGRLQDQLGLEVDIGSSRLGWGGELRLGNVTPGDETTTEGGAIRIGEARLITRPAAILWGNVAKGLQQIALNDVALTFQQTANGAWEPASLLGMNHWLNRWCKIDVVDMEEAQSPSSGQGEAPKNTTSSGDSTFAIDSLQVSVSNAEILWLDAEGTTLAAARDVEAYVTPLELPTRNSTHIHVRSASIDLSSWSSIRDLDVELLRTGDAYRVLRLNAERHTIGQPPAKEPVAPESVVDTVPPAPARPVIRETPLPDPQPPKPPADLETIIREELSNALDE